MSVLRFPEWQKSCRDALLEPDPEKLFLRVIVAETAIFHRLHDFKKSPGYIELQAMDSMLKNLQRLVANSFTPPGLEEEASARPLGVANIPLKANRAKRQTQPSV
jgi:hypothetical protein